MSSASSPQASSSIPPKKVVVPKVWKRPHSTIYGKNVEFGSSLYSDKIGEINGRKFNSELPWTLRNSGTTSSSGSYTSQGYLSNRFSDSCGAGASCSRPVDVDQPVTSLEQSVMAEKLTSSGLSYSQLLDLTNPSRGASSGRGESGRMHADSKRRSNLDSNKYIDFYEKYGHFDKEINDMTNNSLLMNEPLLSRKTFDNFLDFDPELGLFLPHNNSGYGRSSSGSSSSASRDDNQRKSSSRMDINTSFVCPMLMPPTTTTITPNNYQYYCDVDKNLTHQTNHRQSSSKSPLPINTNEHNNSYLNESTNKNNLPSLKQKFSISSSPYGQSVDGRKLSLGSINPHSYRPSLPQKTTTAHASDGDEIEFHDRSSPFYTDR